MHGRVLIVGAGKEPYKKLLKFADRVIVTDVGDWHDGLDDIADAHSLPYDDESFDWVLAIEVFEHLRDPRKAAEEIQRVLSPGGEAVITVPFMFHVHGDPFDFQRLTKDGLMVNFESASTINIYPFGGRSHVISDIITTVAKPFAVFRFINWVLCLPVADRASADCPSGYIVEVLK